MRSNGGGARAPRSQVPATATNTPPAQRSGPTGRGGGVAAFTSHDLRRSYIADPLGAGADLPTVQQIVGYADPATVQQIVGYADPATAARYDRRAAKARKKAASLLNVPYGGYGNQRLFRRPSAWRRRPL